MCIMERLCKTVSKNRTKKGTLIWPKKNTKHVGVLLPASHKVFFMKIEFDEGQYECIPIQLDGQVRIVSVAKGATAMTPKHGLYLSL